MVRVHREELDVEGERTEVPALQGVSRGKLILVNDDDLTYCSLRLDPESLQTVLTRIADIAEPLPRTLAWSAAWEMTREAEMKARDFVALVAAGVRRRDRGRGGAAAAAAGADRAGLATPTRTGRAADGWPPFADRLLELARGAEPGSDHQLAYVNALCTSVLSLRHIAVLAALLDTDPAELGLPGLTVDTDLRWRIVTALAARGRHRRRRAGNAVHRRRGRARSDRRGQAQRGRAPRRRGRSSRSRRRRGSRSSRTTRCPTSSRGRSSTASCNPVRQALLQPFTAKYFDAIPGVWERRSSEVAQTVVIGLYPSWDISQDGLDAADRFLAGDATARAAAAGARGPGRCGARAAGPGLRRQLGAPTPGASVSSVPVTRVKNRVVAHLQVEAEWGEASASGEMPALITLSPLIRPSIRRP